MLLKLQVQKKNPKAIQFLEGLLQKIHCGVFGIGFQSNAGGVKEEVAPIRGLQAKGILKGQTGAMVSIKTVNKGENGNTFVFNIGGLNSTSLQEITKLNVVLTNIDTKVTYQGQFLQKSQGFKDLLTATIEDIPKGTYVLQFA